MLYACIHSKFCSKTIGQDWHCWHECELGLGKCPQDNDKNCEQFNQVIRQINPIYFGDETNE